MPTFADLGVPDDLCDALDARGIVDAFDIQSATIPAALEGKDVAGRAPTGSGKTLAFGIPVVATLERARPKRPRGLILVPTRELAAQVAKDLTWLGAARGTRVQSFYGGVGFGPQIKALRSGVDIAVACPGRLADLINQGLVRLDGVDRVVVDEADRMADMGFLPEVRRLLDQTDPNRQTLLFSATLDGDVDVLIKRYQNNPIRRDVTPADDGLNVTHHHWVVERGDRAETTAKVIKRVGPTIVFSRTRHGADRISRQLEKSGIASVAIHGARSQKQRDRALADFTSGRATAMVATDVAARGIHVDGVACVVHFDLPADHKDYVHRSGRTGRAGSHGSVVAFVPKDQRKDARKLARALDLDVDQTPSDIEVLPISKRPVAKASPAGQDRGRQTDRSRKGRPSGQRKNSSGRSHNQNGSSSGPKGRQGARRSGQGGETSGNSESEWSTKGSRRSNGPSGDGRPKRNGADNRRNRDDRPRNDRDDNRTRRGSATGSGGGEGGSRRGDDSGRPRSQRAAGGPPKRSQPGNGGPNRSRKNSSKPHNSGGRKHAARGAKSSPSRAN